MVEGIFFPRDVDVDVGDFSRGASGGFELLVSKTLRDIIDREKEWWRESHGHTTTESYYRCSWISFSETLFERFIVSGKRLTIGIFDRILPSGYKACELYARNLMEGWMSVGDECLKFMREDYWSVIPTEAT